MSLGGGGWAKVMALAIALSVVATTGTGIVLSARIVYGMASRRVLPPVLARVSPRFATPVLASIICGLLIVGISGVYLLASSSVQNAFDNVVAVTGLLFSIFYILTAVTLVVYYRRLITRSVRNAIVLGVLPLAAAGFLGWVLVLSLKDAPASQVDVGDRDRAAGRRADARGQVRVPLGLLLGPPGELPAGRGRYGDQ
jgi:amino acid transporter